MAGWRDFVNAITQEVDDKKKGVKDWLNSPLPNNLRDNEAYKTFSRFDEKIAEPVVRKASDFLSDTLQSIPRGAVNIGLTAKEAIKDNSLSRSNKNIEDVLSIKKEDRDRLVADLEDPEKSKSLTGRDRTRALLLSKMKKELGSLDDEKLNQRKQANSSKKDQNETYKASNDFTKFLIGGEDDEVAKSAQQTSGEARSWLSEQGATDRQAKFGGVLAGVGVTALDSPVGGGSLAKSPLKALGKQGIEALAKEGTAEGVESIIKKAIPGVADNVLKDLAPKIAAETDTKAIKALFGQGDNLIPGIRGTAGSKKDEIIQSVKNFVSPSNTKNAANANSYGDAADELLGRLKTSSELPKNKKGFRESFKEQFVDKLSPVNDMVKTIEERTGKKLMTEDNPYELMRLYNGMPDRVQQRVAGLTDILKQAPDLDAVKIIGVGRQVRGRAERGVSSFIAPDKAQSAIRQVYDRLGPEGFDQAAKVVDTVNEYNRGLLDDLHDAGIISDDAFRAINEVGADYFSRFNVIDYIMKSDSNRELFAKTGSYNTTKQTLNKILATAKGMEEGTEILDPIESIVKSTDQVMRTIAKNEIWHAFDRLEKVAPDLIVRARDPEKVVQRVALSLDNKELRPVRNKLDRMLSTRGKWVRKLESQVNQLNKKGLDISLKKGGEKMDPADFLVDGLGGRVPTSKTGKVSGATRRVGDETVRGFIDVVNPQKLGPSDTAAFVRNLIEKGSQRDIDRIQRMIGTRDANLSKLLDEIKVMKAEFDDIASTVKGNTDQIKDLADTAAPEGMELISGFGKGVQGKLAVPKEIADVFTGKNKAQQDYLTSMMSTVNAFVKQNFTSNNPAFALITNPIRDAKTFAYNAKDVKSDPLSIGKALAEGLWSRTFGKGELYDRWVAAGGKSGFYADERTADKLAKDLTREISGKRVLGVKTLPINSTKDFIREATRVASAPLRVARDALQGTASVLEDAPRLAQFNASVKAGKTDAQAAINSRNVTVDFQQSGRIGQVVNAWVPFLNARFQGTLKSADAIKNNPARAAAVYAGLTAAPILMTAAQNSRFPEVMKMISDEDRDNNFVIVFGDNKDEDGNFTQVLKFPKGDLDKILGNPLEQIARFAADDDPDGLAEIITNMVGDTLPVDVVRDDAISPGRAIGGILPPVIKAPIEAATNKNLYFGSDIVPESLQDLPADQQTRESTSAAGKFLGAVTGSSPLIAENTLRNFTGSLLTKSPQDQMGGKLAGASGNKMNDEFYKTLNKTSPNRASASKYINESLAKGDYQAAQQAADTYNAYLRESFTPFGNTYGSQMTAELSEIYDKQKIVLTSRSIKQRQRNQIERQAAGAIQ